MLFQDSAPQIIHHLAIWLVAILSIAFGLSLLARYSWVFDLFSHFVIQYMFLGFILAIILLYFREWLFAGLGIAIFIAAIYQLHPKLDNKPNPSAAEITVVQYNKLYISNIYQPMLEWLRKNSNQFDVVTIQEIDAETIEKLQTLNDVYPYRYPEKRMGGADAYLMSRYPFESSETVETGDKKFTTLGLRVKIKKPQIAEPITIYTIHAKTPMSQRLQQKRNRQLSDIAEHIRHDSSRNILLMGDWNITPYSPYFHDLLRVSGLRHDYFGLWPVTTWPSVFMLPVFKISIDHVLSNSNMRLVEQKAGPFLWSDHNPHIASFAFNRND